KGTQVDSIMLTRQAKRRLKVLLATAIAAIATIYVVRSLLNNPSSKRASSFDDDKGDMLSAAKKAALKRKATIINEDIPKVRLDTEDFSVPEMDEIEKAESVLLKAE